MTRLLLIRHAVTDETGKVLSGRLPGRSLNSVGVEMASQLADRLRPIKLAAVYASPLERTMETAVPLARGRPVVAEPGLIETDYGSWSGRNLRSLYRLRLWQVVVTSPSRIRFPGGESLLEMQQRMVATIEDLARRHRKQTIALVSHADPIKAAVSHYLGQPLDLFNRIDITPASVTILNLTTGRPPHLGTINNIGEPSSWL